MKSPATSMSPGSSGSGWSTARTACNPEWSDRAEHSSTKAGRGQHALLRAACEMPERLSQKFAHMSRAFRLIHVTLHGRTERCTQMLPLAGSR